MKSAVCISAAIHALSLFTAVGIAAPRVAPKVPRGMRQVIEVELGAPPRIRRSDAGRQTVSRAEKAPVSTVAHASPPPDMEPTLPTASLPPLAAQDDSATSAVAYSSGLTAQGAAGDHDNSAGSAEATSSIGAGRNPSAGAAQPSVLPYVVSSPPPPYPVDARRKGWTGRVRVKVLISELGTVQDTAIATSSGYACLDEAALKALRTWQFHPAYKDGHAVAAWVVVPVLFKLDRG